MLSSVLGRLLQWERIEKASSSAQCCGIARLVVVVVVVVGYIVYDRLVLCWLVLAYIYVCVCVCVRIYIYIYMCCLYVRGGISGR